MNVTHEVKNRAGFFTEVRDGMAENARYLLVEPIFHVNQKVFDNICGQCQSAGLDKKREVKIPHSRAALFTKTLD